MSSPASRELAGQAGLVVAAELVEAAGQDRDRVALDGQRGPQHGAVDPEAVGGDHRAAVRRPAPQARSAATCSP